MTSGELGVFLREVSAKDYDIPGSTNLRVSVRTLERWISQYRKEGFDGLKTQI